MDDNHTQGRPRRAHVAPVETFDRTLARIMFACDHLGAAIRGQHVEEVQRTAAEAVESWLALRAALRRLELTAVVDRQRVQAARSVTRAYRRALADLLARAQAQLAAAHLHDVLGRLRASLAVANDEH